jgi:uncharacterized membrane protein YcaP (DUF421 family)
VLELFEVRMSIAELVVRGSAIFWFLFLVFRFVLRRDVGAVGVADMLLLVIVADASQNAMSGQYTTITEGLILVGTIVGWNWLLDYVAFRSKTARKLINPGRLLLISDGRPVARNMQKQYITLDDLRAKLREQGIETMGVVKRAYLEADGEVSIIRYAKPAHQPNGKSGRKRTRPGV